MRCVLVSIIMLVCLAWAFLSLTEIKVQEYEGTTPKVDLKQFFNGDLTGFGTIHDWRGKLIHSFKIDMKSEWHENMGAIDENYTFEDGTVKRMIWTIEIRDDNNFTIKAPHIIGVGEGKQIGSVANSEYVLEVPFKDTKIDLDAKEWMTLVNDNKIISKVKMRKFGLTVATAHIAIVKNQN